MTSTPGGHFRRPDPANQRTRRPGTDRPSLFAGMDDDVVDVEPDRIRILSSLDARRSRQASKSPRSGRSHHGARSRGASPTRWWSHVLLGLMGMGLFTVALAVFLIIKSSRDSELPLTRWDVVSPATMTATDDPDALLSSQPPGAGMLSAEVAEAETFGLLHQELGSATTAIDLDTPESARIEPTTAEAAAASATPAVSEPPDAPAQVPAQAQTRPSPSAAATTAAATPTITPATKPSLQPTIKPAPQATAGAPPSADVRLLEAVFPKHDPRTASKSELFKACQGMTGAESAICRARICVQHPGVPACQ